jgi:uncharacterized protein (DUF2164 family)
MAIQLNSEKQERCLNSLKEYVRDNLDVDVGDLRARLFLDYILREIAPVVYNQGVRDAREYVEERLLDIEANCYEIEFPDDRR